MWTFSTGDVFSIESSPSIGPDGTIYLVAQDGNLYTLNSDGSQNWVFFIGRFSAIIPVFRIRWDSLRGILIRNEKADV